MFTGGKALNGRGVERLPTPIKLRMPEKRSSGVRLCEISLTVERETAQTYSSGPEYMLSGEGCGNAKTTRMLAQKQPLIQRVRNSSLVE